MLIAIWCAITNYAPPLGIDVPWAFGWGRQAVEDGDVRNIELMYRQASGLQFSDRNM